MLLSQLLRDLECDLFVDGLKLTDRRRDEVLATLQISEVREDSRAVQPGDLFVALAGQATSGQRFLQDAVARGAKVLVVQQLEPSLSQVVQVLVSSTAQALASIAANRYDRPGDQLALIAITGTNGKTTTNFLVDAMLEEAGLLPGLIGTVAYRYRGQSKPAPFTTPTPLLLHQTLAEMRASGVRTVTLEASSHALALHRLHGLHFRVVAFSNLTQDHLDFHHTMDAYFAAKASLFAPPLLPLAGDTPDGKPGIGVVNIDDPAGRRLAQLLPAEARLTVSIDGPADIRVVSEQHSIDGINATLSTPAGSLQLQSALTGRFNLANLALAAGIGVALGLPLPQIARGLARLPGVPGRMERVPLPAGVRGPAVFVDYAHTPDALTRALAALRPLAQCNQPSGRLITVFGCGGDRDAGKRPQMGQAVAQAADLLVVTSDNPRTENPQAILDMIVAGIAAAGTESSAAVATQALRAPRPPRLDREGLATAATGFFVEPDRRLAIQSAILAARPEDVVLLAGKGHEDYQILGTTKLHFDDREEAARALQLRDGATPRVGSTSSPGLPAVTASAPIGSSIELPVDRVLAATQGKLVRSGPHKFSAVTIDSRHVTPGCLFVAVHGERHDGHAFLAAAAAAGAAGLLVQSGNGHSLPTQAGLTIIEVGDTVTALGQLARAHRDAPEIAGKLRVVAITGSSGKTTTKDLIAAILTAQVSDPSEVCKTDGNLNNHLGVPLTLLKLRPGQRYAVVEMGMSARGEIAYLVSLARPDVGVITNVGPAHLETLGTLENIARAKGELFSGLLDGATAVYLQGPAQVLVQQEAVRASVLSGRLRNFAALSLRPREASSESLPQKPSAGCCVTVQLLHEGEDGLSLSLTFPTLPVGQQTLTAELPLLGAHQADNAALAAAAALALDVAPAHIAAGLARALPGKHRGQVQVLAGRRVLDDCYNANPASMAAALRTLRSLHKPGRAIAVLGDMLELGPTELQLHSEIGEVVAEVEVALLITVGKRAAHIAETAAKRGVITLAAADAEAAAQALLARTEPGDWILLKGSRGMALEGVLDRFRALCANGTEAAPAADQGMH